MMELKKCCNHCYLVRPPEEDLNKTEALQVTRLCHLATCSFHLFNGKPVIRCIWKG